MLSRNLGRHTPNIRTRAGQCLGRSNGNPREHCWILHVRKNAALIISQVKSCQILTIDCCCSGNIKLPALFPIFGKTQLQILSILSALLLLITNGITVYSVSERVLVEPPPKRSPTGENSTSFEMLRTVQDIWKNALTLPYVIMRIVRAWMFDGDLHVHLMHHFQCMIQFLWDFIRLCFTAVN